VAEAEAGLDGLLPRKHGARIRWGIGVRNVLVLTGERPLHFTRQEAESWVGSKDATWEGQTRRRVRLTVKGRARYREIKPILKLRGFSTVVGEVIALNREEPWARAFVGQQFSAKKGRR
jgi:hypothetical protein